MKLTEKVLNTVNEMGTVGKFSNCTVIANSLDHGQPHVHYLCDGKLVAKIEIPNKVIKNQSELKIVEKGSAYKEYLMTDFVKWVNSTKQMKDGSKMKNYDYASTAWDILHNIV